MLKVVAVGFAEMIEAATFGSVDMVVGMPIPGISIVVLSILAAAMPKKRTRIVL